MILGYHELTAEPSSYSYSISCKQFEAHLAAVAGMHRKDAALPSKVHVTFDDGHKSIQLYAADLLERYSIRATFFVIAGWIGVRDNFMTWSDVKELAARGHSVQSHGWSHQFLTNCSDGQLTDELQRSKHKIEDVLGRPVESLSVPYGRWDQRVMDACRAADYRSIYTSEPVTAVRARNGVPIFGRFMVRRTMTSRQLQRLAAGGNLYSMFHNTRHHAKESVKRLMGDRLYHRVWCSLAS